MMEIETALARAHRDNIQRYHKLLKTNLTDVERNYIEELQLRVDANNAQSGVSLKIEEDTITFNSGHNDLHLILESQHIVLHVLARHAYVVVGDLVADRGQREWPTGPSVRRER